MANTMLLYYVLTALLSENAGRSALEARRKDNLASKSTSLHVNCFVPKQERSINKTITLKPGRFVRDLALDDRAFKIENGQHKTIDGSHDDYIIFSLAL